jgi:hypothetical protein
MIKKIKDLWNRRKWKLYLYYDGIKIKRLKVYQEELSRLKEKRYVVNVYFKKQLFNSRKVNIIVSPRVLLNTNNDARKIYVGVVLEKGQEL